MPLLSYTPNGTEWQRFAPGAKDIFEKLMSQPLGTSQSRADFVRMLQADLHPGRAAVRWNPARGMVEAPGGSAPSQGQSARGMRTPMATGVAVHIGALQLARLTIESENIEFEDLARAARHEVDMMIIALVKTCHKLQPQAERASGDTLPRTRTRRAVNIIAWSRAS